MNVTGLNRTTVLVISQPLRWRCHNFPTFGNFQYIITFSLSLKGCFTYYDWKSEEPQRDIREHLLSNDNRLTTSFYTSASILVWWVSSPHSQVKPSIWTLANSLHSGFRLLWFLFPLLYQFPPPLWAVFFKTKPPEASLHETKPSEASLQKTKRSSTQKSL